MAALEEAEDALVTASGIGAISTVMWTFLKRGDHLLADNALYGDTHALFEEALPKFGVETDFVDFNVAPPPPFSAG
jgi:Cystathionine beta-lyases/cystathionine gamma-synthases